MAAHQALAVLDELAEELKLVTEPLVLVLLRRRQQLQLVQPLTRLGEIANQRPSVLSTLAHAGLPSVLCLQIPEPRDGCPQSTHFAPFGSWGQDRLPAHPAQWRSMISMKSTKQRARPGVAGERGSYLAPGVAPRSRAIWMSRVWSRVRVGLSTISSTTVRSGSVTHRRMAAATSSGSIMVARAASSGGSGRLS